MVRRSLLPKVPTPRGWTEITIVDAPQELQ
jgi:hypothetical protein